MKKIQNIYVTIDNSQTENNTSNQKSQVAPPSSLIPYTTSAPRDVFDVDETFDDYSLYLPSRQQHITYKMDKVNNPDPNSYTKPHTFPMFDEKSALSPNLAMRILFKPHSNTLWAYNNFWCKREHFMDRHKVKSS